MQSNGSIKISNSKEIYKSLFDNCHSVILIIHSDSVRIIDANEAACQYYGPQN